MANPLVWGCAIMDKSTAKLPATALNMNGTGPWKQTMYRPNSQLAFSQYSEYWGTKTVSKALDIVYMPSSQSQVNSLQSGKVDLIFPGEPGAKSLATTKGVTVKQVGSDSTIFLQINNLSKPFDNQKVRQALALAFDRQKLADQAYHGAARPSVYVPPEISWAVPIAQLPYSQPDVAKAKALLAEAGYPNGFTTSLMYINAYDPGTNDLVAAMQTQLAAIGITVTLQPLQATAWNDKLLNANYTLSWNAQSYYSNPFQYIQPAPGRQGPVPASLQKLLDAALNAGSQTEYEAALQAVENEEATLVYPTVTLLASNSFVAYNTQLTGVAGSSSGSREFLAQVAHK
jgi:ABC-type transport system substrate-binding protein